MNVLVYGAGAVGLGLASCLLKSGNAVDVIAREETVAELRRGGLMRTGIFGEFSAEPAGFGAFASLADLPDREYDFALVCVKSFDTARAAKDLASDPGFAGSATPLVLCQNGWGNAEIFCERFPESRIKNARVITGFSRPGKNVVDITVHADAIHIGNLYGDEVASLAGLAEAIDRGGIPCQVTDAIGKDLWAKMLYNGALNGLGAILRVPYGLLGDSPETRRLMDAIVEEIFQVMGPAGFSTHWDTPSNYLEGFYGSLLPSTYKHESSMLQDIRAGKRTEIDAMNGAIVNLGHRFHVPVPFNETVVRMIKFIESGIRNKPPAG